MYQSFFQFSQLPFQITPNPYFFFFSKHHEEALSHVTYGIQERKGFILITGEVGTGKTTLCRLLLERLGPGVKTSLIFNPNLATLELLQSINQDFGLGGASSSKKELVDELNRFLLKELQNGGNAVLIIDEAQNLPAQCLEEIRMLSNLETQDAKLLQILLVGQPELRDKLAVPELRQLNQRIALRYHLLPLTEDEVRGYIAYRLRMANGGERVFFTPEAMGAIYRYSGGIPRLINILCDKALLAAFVAESRVVSKEIVGDAISDLEGLVKGRRSHRIKGAAPFPPDRWHAMEKLKQRVSPIGLGIFIFFFLSILGGVAFWWRTQLPDPSLREARVEESQPVPLPARVEGIRPDSDGIFREENAEDSRRGALLTLMALWDPRFYEDALWDRMKEAGSDVMGLVRSEGFELVPIPMELERVNRLDYPVLMELDEGVERGRHSAVLWQIQGEEALVLDPLRGRESYPLERLEAIWGEKGEILWRPLDGLGFRMAVGEHGTQVARLQGFLKERGFYEGEVDGKFGLLTQEGVSRLQKGSGLQVDGVFGVESALILKKQVFGQGVPSLQQKPLIPAIDSKSIPRPS